jgi:hypothetical protein
MRKPTFRFILAYIALTGLLAFCLEAVASQHGFGVSLAVFLALGALPLLLNPPRYILGVNNPTIVGNNTVIWGTGNIYAGTGIITGAEKGSSADKIEIQDETGYVVTVIYFNQKNECSFEMVVKTSIPTLAIGDAITIAGTANCHVDDIRVVWSQKDVAKYSIKATKYSGLTEA